MTDTLTLNGTTYDSYQAVATAFGIGYTTLMARINKGKSLAEAVHSPIFAPGTMNHKKVTCGGEVYSSHKDLCQEMGLNYSTFNSHLRRGKSVEEAVKLTLDAKKTIKVLIGGQVREFKNIKQAAEDLELKYGTLSARVRKGESPVEAIMTLYSKSKGLRDHQLKALAQSLSK